MKLTDCNKFTFLLLILTFFPLVGQQKYPTNAFRNPLDIPIILAGTFGELRTNHFHSGIDIKTKGVSGKKVYAAKEGYVSRIKISHWGYGKALYITHPNGYTTVYGHLKKFSDKIEKYIKKRQYKIKSFEVQAFPTKEELPISANEIVAFAGNTGGSSAPHLHFEIRDTKTEKVINPLLFGYNVKDNITPTFRGLRAIPIGTKSAVNSLPVAQKINTTKINNKLYVADEIEAIGTIGLAVRTHDILNYASNKNGVYSIDMVVNDTLVYHHDLETFAFNESKYINLLIDYPFYGTKYRKYQKTYIEPANKLSIYKKSPTKGYLNIQENEHYLVEIVIKDIAKNTTKIRIPIKGVNQFTSVIKENEKTPFYIDRSQYTIFKEGLTEIRFPKRTFYENTYIDFESKPNNIKVHKPVLPLDKNYTLTYFTDTLTTSEKQYAYFGLKSGRNYRYVNTTKREGKIYTNTKYLGTFSVLFDSIAPKIYKANFYNNQNLSKSKYLSIHIKDDKTGIKNYYATIDNKWILMEYEPKKNKLTFDLNDLAKTNKKHTFKLKIEDLLGNTKTYEANFIK